MAKTIKVIDLLNKIANGEEVPKKIKIRDKIYEYKYTSNGTGYVTENWDWFNDMMLDEQLTLNMDVEIIEEQQDIDKIKTLNPEEVYFKDGTELVYKLMYDKINEIAMRLNKIDKNIKDKE